MSTEGVKHAVDVGAALVMLTTLAKWLPPLAALFTIIWTGLRIYDWVVEKLEKRRAG